MTDTTKDIADLREVAGIGETSDWMTWPKVDPAKLNRVLDMLEAERQRADELQRLVHVEASSFANDRVRADKLAAHIEALKGDQVPVGIVAGYDIHIDENIIAWTEAGADLPIGTELFTAPQKPVVLQDVRDAQRYRWLRGDIPTLNGDPHDFYVWDMRGQQYEECGEHLDGIDLDKAIDKKLSAIEAAGGKVAE